MTTFKRYTVTAALPYANGPLHIGHLAGAYLPADIYVRYLRLKGADVKFICGSDEHGVPITLRARAEGKSPQEIVDKYHRLNAESFQQLGISFDVYHRTSDKLHHQTASEFFKTLYDKKIFEEKETEQFYDEEAKQFLADRYIIGTCPKCGYDNAYGDQCEKCGTTLSPQELKQPRSALSGKPPVLKKTKHWFLPLDKMQREWLEKWIDSKKDKWKSNVYGQCKSWLNEGLKPRAVTRDLDWGVPVPLPEAKGKVLYVWFDAPVGYISATKALTKEWEKYWKDPDTCLVHFIGKDNIVFHCIIFPAMLKAHGGYILPEHVPANEFLNLEGDKISTSRNRAVWLGDYLKDFPGKEDVLRYVLCANMPEAKDNDFTWKDFQAKNNNELVAVLGNFVNRTLVLTEKYFDSRVPQLDRDTINEKLIRGADIGYIASVKAVIERSIEKFRFREGLNALMDLAREGNKYLTQNEPWKSIDSNKYEAQCVIFVSLQIVANLAILMKPFLPLTSKKLLEMLRIREQELKWQRAASIPLPLLPGHKLMRTELLFEKIEDDIIEKQIQKINSMTSPAKSNVMTANDTASAKSNPATFDDFSKLDIRIGTIVAAEKVEKADKLLKLTVDIGTEQRTIVSGIAEQYTPETVTGQQVSVIVNLQPRKIRGVESQGMILMAEDKDGRLTLISPKEKISNGSTIR